MRNENEDGIGLLHIGYSKMKYNIYYLLPEGGNAITIFH